MADKTIHNSGLDNDIGIGDGLEDHENEIDKEAEVKNGNLVFKAKWKKSTANYEVYEPQLVEDPPEFLPNRSIYVGNHLDVKRIIIELEKE
jgi:hypothetical protein